jgi:hypothetical protein
MTFQKIRKRKARISASFLCWKASAYFLFELESQIQQAVIDLSNYFVAS